MATRGFGYRGKGRKGIAGRQIKRPRKTGVHANVGTRTKKVKSPFGGTSGTFGFR